MKAISKEEIFYKTWSKSARTVFDNERFYLLEKEDFHVIEYHEKQVIVLPVLADKSIIMPKVKRHILGQAVWELPAGGLNNGESECDGALRELREETGVSIFDITRLKYEKTLIVSQNRLPMFPSIFSIDVTEIEFDQRSIHDTEVDSVKAFSFNEIRNMIITGKILTSITISILGRFLLSKEIACL